MLVKNKINSKIIRTAITKEKKRIIVHKEKEISHTEGRIFNKC